MLSLQDNELICRIGPGTAMGDVMRRFWVPACMSSELPERDCDPVHIELLGENLVAFRDRTGQVGLLDEFCCHRGASLTVGRVENCGIRCVYHGWLFSADGTVLETPNVPDPRFKERFKAKAYPVREAGGFIWTYLGPSEKVPAFPDFPWIDAPQSMRLVACQINGCNYVQMLEGILDSSHLSVLHSSALQKAHESELNFAKATSHMQFDATPRIEAEETEFGLHYAAIRAVDGRAETRVTAFVAPFWVLNPNGDVFNAVVPMSDTKTAFYVFWWDGENEYGAEPMRSQQLDLVGFDETSLRSYGQTRDTYYGPERPGRHNGFRQDRSMMREGHFTGMPSLALEDSLVCVSAGPLRDRRNEHLSVSDGAIAQLYRHLLRTAKRVRDGLDPIGLGISARGLKGTNARLDGEVRWQSLVEEHYRPEKDMVLSD